MPPIRSRSPSCFLLRGAPSTRTVYEPALDGMARSSVYRSLSESVWNTVLNRSTIPRFRACKHWLETVLVHLSPALFFSSSPRTKGGSEETGLTRFPPNIRTLSPLTRSSWLRMKGRGRMINVIGMFHSPGWARAPPPLHVKPLSAINGPGSCEG